MVNRNSGWAPIYGAWEPEAQRVFIRLIKQGDVVYDLGANTGINSLLFSKLVGTGGKVICFEPIPENIKEIESLRDLNRVANFHIINKAVGNACCTAAFNVPNNDNKVGSLRRFTDGKIRVIKIEETTLDEEINRGLALPDFIKMDVEGSESEVLEGLSKSIDKSWPIFSVELHIPEQDTKVGRFFKEHGYSLYRLNNESARRYAKQKELLFKVTDMEAGWPDVHGVWGTVIAIPAPKKVIL